MPDIDMSLYNAKQLSGFVDDMRQVFSRPWFGSRLRVPVREPILTRQIAVREPILTRPLVQPRHSLIARQNIMNQIQRHELSIQKLQRELNLL